MISLRMVFSISSGFELILFKLDFTSVLSLLEINEVLRLFSDVHESNPRAQQHQPDRQPLAQPGSGLFAIDVGRELRLRPVRPKRSDHAAGHRDEVPGLRVADGSHFSSRKVRSESILGTYFALFFWGTGKGFGEISKHFLEFFSVVG